MTTHLELDYSYTNKPNNLELENVTLQQGLKYEKYQKKIKNKVVKKNLLFEGFQSKQNQNQLPHNQPLDSMREINETHKLISQTDNAVTSQIKELQSLQEKFNTILEQYNGSNTSLINSTKKYIQKISDSNNPMNTNVYVNSMATNVKNKYLGCYADSDTRAMTGTAALSGQYVSFDQCKQSAIDSGYKYFGLQNFQSSNQTGWCAVSNDLTASTQYGKSIVYESVLLWSTATAGEGNYLQIDGSGMMVVKNVNGDLVWQSANAPADCVFNGGINDVNATAGANCNGQNGWSVQNGNANDSLMNYSNPIGKSAANYIVEINMQDVAYGCPKAFDISYKCGTTIKTGHIDGEAGGQNFLMDCTAEFNSCSFFLMVQNDGNMCFNRGTPNGSATTLWCSMTNGKQQKPNPDWVATKGKYGLNYLTNNQILGPGEWVGSDDGTLVLIMQTDGNVCLYTSTPQDNCSKGVDGNSYGGAWANSIYELDKVGILGDMGKVGHINEETKLSEYPASMIQMNKGTSYSQTANYNYPGNDIKRIDNSTVDACKTECDLTEGCVGFAFSKNESICWPKNSTMLTASKYYDTDTDMYFRNPMVQNNTSCTKNMETIDTLQWEKYEKTGVPMSQNTVCGLQKATQNENINRDALRTQLDSIADEIVNKITYLESLNSDLRNQMGIDKSVLEENLKKYKALSKQYTQYKTVDATNINGILSDSDIVVLQENYSYLFWSILALAVVVITLHAIKK